MTRWRSSSGWKTPPLKRMASTLVEAVGYSFSKSWKCWRRKEARC
jgi:hypothetical protein